LLVEFIDFHKCELTFAKVRNKHFAVFTIYNANYYTNLGRILFLIQKKHRIFVPNTIIKDNPYLKIKKAHL